MKKRRLRFAAFCALFLMIFSLASCGSEKSAEANTGAPPGEKSAADSPVDFKPIDPGKRNPYKGVDLAPGDEAPIALMYHSVLEVPTSSLEGLFVRPSELRGQIEALLDAGYTFIFADEYARYDGKTVIVTFDDGYLDNYTEVFPIVEEYGVKITVFMITNYINGADYLTEDMIREMASSGLVSFQSHTASHRNLTYLSEDDLREEFRISNETLERLTGRKVTSLCYPTGAYDYFTVSAAEEFYNTAYTTVNNLSTAGFSKLELPRMRVSRGINKEYFSQLIP